MIYYDCHMLFNPLVIILNQNRFTRPNYMDWKRNVDIVLMIEGYKYFLTKEHPNLLVPMHLDWKEKDIKNELKLMRWHVAVFSFDVFSFTTPTKKLFECYGYNPKPQRDVWGIRTTI